MRESHDLRSAVASWDDARIVDERAASLDEIFVAHVGSAAQAAAE
jgi:hypothetical protein